MTTDALTPNAALVAGQALQAAMLVPAKSKLPGDVQIHKGSTFESANRLYVVLMQDDGNLVLYRSAGLLPIWGAGTYNSPGAFVQIQDSADGNVVIYTADGTKALWSTGTSGTARPGAYGNVDDDGHLRFYGADGVAFWSTP